MSLVDEIEKKDRRIFVCEICENGYPDLETAERCEQYCYSHGKCSLWITKKAIVRPEMRMLA